VSKWVPCKRRDLIRRLKKLGFTDPVPGAKHEFMRYGRYKQTISNNPCYDVNELRMLIEQIEEKLGRKISADEWNKL